MEKNKLAKATELYGAVMDKKEERLRHKQQLARIQSLEKAMVSSLSQLVQFLNGKITKTEVVNQLKSISTPDVDKVVKAISQLDESMTKNKLDITSLEKGLESLEAQLKKLPTSFPDIPDHPDSVKVNNLSEIDLKPLEKAIKALKLDPKINVASPNVKVDAPNLEPLKKALLDVVKAVEDKQIPATDVTGVEDQLKEANKKLQKIVEKPTGGSGGGTGTSFKDSNGKLVYAELDDGAVPTNKAEYAKKITVDGLTTYVAQAAPGTTQSTAAWRVKKIVDVGVDTIITWADGNTDYDNIATDLTALSYS